MKLFSLLLALLIGLSCGHYLHAKEIAGYVIGWGQNVSGEATGVPSFPTSNGVVVVTDNPYTTGAVMIAGQVLGDTVEVSADGGFSLALMSDGTVVGWGGNQRGRAIGTETPAPHRTAGTVAVGGNVLSNVIAIAAGGSFSLALKADGSVVAWGNNTVPSGLSNLVAIAARGFFSVALKSDGTVASWGSAPWNKTHVPDGLSNVVAIACGGGQYERSLALKKDGTVTAWGSETIHGDMTPPVGLSNVIAITAGHNHSLALKQDGSVVGWGFNGSGQATGVPTKQSPYRADGLVTIGGHILSNAVAVAAGKGYSLALKADGTVSAWGRMNNGLQPVTVPAGLSNVVAIAAGDNFCLAITTNNTTSVISE